MAAPDYLVCLDCETPCYDFEWAKDTIVEILCEICGNDDIDRFLSQEDYDALLGDDR